MLLLLSIYTCGTQQTGSSGEARFVLHVPSSLRAAKRYIYIYIYTYTKYFYSYYCYYHYPPDEPQHAS